MLDFINRCLNKRKKDPKKVDMKVELSREIMSIKIREHGKKAPR